MREVAMKAKTKDLLKAFKAGAPEDLLCFKSISYCCSLDKNCPRRSLYMQINNISNEDFVRLKTECGEKFKEIARVSLEVELPEIKQK